MQALIAAGWSATSRARTCCALPAPLYNDLDDVSQAVATLARILRDGSWDSAEFRRKAAVT